jgi:hypothetical protein
MKNASIPRFLIVGMIILIMGISLVGSLHAFATAHAKSDPGVASKAAASLKIKTEATATAGPLAETTTPVPYSMPAPVPPSADTNGIIALTIMIVVILLFGAAWGMRKLPDRKKRPR